MANNPQPSAPVCYAGWYSSLKVPKDPEKIDFEYIVCWVQPITDYRKPAYVYRAIVQKTETELDSFLAAHFKEDDGIFGSQIKEFGTSSLSAFN